jgi:hypothetical protein
MGIGAVAAGSVLLVVMLGVSVYAAVTLPLGAQVPVRRGLGGYSNWQPKRVALALWSGSVVVIYVAILAMVVAAGWNGRIWPALTLPVAQLVLIFNQMGAVRAARSRSGGGTARR